MPRVSKRLSSDMAIKKLKPKEGQTRPTRFPVFGEPAGLCIQLTPSGSKTWLLRVTTGIQPDSSMLGATKQVRREFGLGPYPAVSLLAAREKAVAMREQVSQGLDPKAEKKAALSAALVAKLKIKTFAECEAATLETKKPSYKSNKTAVLWRTCFDTYVNPKLGKRPIGEIDATEIAAALEPIWRTKYPTAKKTRQWISAVFDYAKAKKLRTGDNPAEWKGCLEPLLGKPRHKVKHYPSLPYPRMAEFMADLRRSSGVSARALEFAILTVARSDEVRSATWDEFDLKKRVWSIPGERMKREVDHRVPLSDAAIKLLKKQPHGEEDIYPFANTNGNPLSDMIMSKLIKDMHVANVKIDGQGYFDPKYDKVAVPHGFRSSFKDWARNLTKYADEVSELALAHINSDETRAAYARDELLGLRRPMMQKWANYCLSTRPRSR